jgi:tetratricopeptide (TPR) repeat protein
LRRAPALATLAVLFIVAAVFAVFHGVLDNGFVNWDDQLYTASTASLLPPFTSEKLQWMLTDRTLFYWHPLAYLWHFVDNSLWPGEPRWHHLGSVVLHACNGVLLFLLCIAFLGFHSPASGGTASEEDTRHARRSIVAAGMAAVLFSIHPLRVESVAWVSEKKDLLCGFFFLAMALAWISYGRCAESGARARWYALTLLLFIGALASKPMAVTGPGVLLLLDFVPLGRLRSLKELFARLEEKWPFILLAVAALLYSATGAKSQDITAARGEFNLAARMVGPLWGFAAGIAKTIWPSPLVAFYPTLEAAEVGHFARVVRHIVGAGVLVTGSLVAVVAWRRGWRGVTAAWVAYLFLTFPVSGVRRLASIETADRFSYLPTVAFFVLGAVGVCMALEAGRRANSILAPAVALAMAASAMGAFGVLTVRQVEVWSTSESLWTNVIEVYPRRVYHAHANLGTWYQGQAALAKKGGRGSERRALLSKASEQYEIAIALSPRAPVAYTNLGVIRLLQGHPEESLRHLERAVELAPRFAEAHAHLAAVLMYARRTEEAEEHYRVAKTLGMPAHTDIMQRIERELKAQAREGGGTELGPDETPAPTVEERDR